MSRDNEESYDAISSQFADSRSKSSIHEFVVYFANQLKSGDSVLDIGCGSGLPNAKFLADKGCVVTGIDISSKLLEEARKNVPQAKFIKSDIVEFCPNEKFNGIIAWDSLFHLRFDDQESVFDKISNLLNPNGYFLFTHGGGVGGEITGEMYGHQFSYSTLGPDKTRRLLEKLGFRVVKWDINEKDNGYMIGIVKN